MAVINGVDIQSIAFGSAQVEITYAEERDTDSPTGIMEYRTLVVPHGVIDGVLAELLDSCQQVLDTALIAKRNPKAVT